MSESKALFDRGPQTEHTVPLPTTPTEQLDQPPLPQTDAPQPSKSKKHWIGYPVTALVALGIGASGGNGAPSPAPATAVPVTITQTVTTAEPAVTITQTVRETVKAAAAAPVSKAAPAAKIVVPDGVGLNYQEAQDQWRAAGLVVGVAVDATGANRLPVLDSNWVVLSQDLKAGTRVDADSVITATVKKYTDG